LSQVEQNRDQLTCICANLVGEVLDGCTAANSYNCVAITAWDHRTAKARCLALLKLLALCAL